MSLYDICDRCGYKYLPKMLGRHVLLTPCPMCSTRPIPPEEGEVTS